MLVRSPRTSDPAVVERVTQDPVDNAKNQTATVAESGICGMVQSKWEMGICPDGKEVAKSMWIDQLGYLLRVWHHLRESIWTRKRRDRNA